MRNQNLGHSVARILMVSPVQNELLRRNKSRVFISPVGEGVIDNLLFAGQRPIEDFIEVATAAIAMAGLTDPTGEINLRPAFAHDANSLFQQHLVSTGWLQNEENVVVDLVIEVDIQGEVLPDINMTTFNGNMVDGREDNPLCIFCDIQDLYVNQSDDVDSGQDNGGDQQIEQIDNSQRQDEMVGNNGQDNQDDGGNGGPQGQGRVVDPSTDRRLKGNREMARRTQVREETEQGTSVNGRMAGRPGRVRDPAFDMRIKANRLPQNASAGGR